MSFKVWWQFIYLNLHCISKLNQFLRLDDHEGEEIDGLEGDEDRDGDQNLAVYDFDEGEEGGSAEGVSEDEDIKPRLSKGGLKKITQTVSQAHMCNYCNYTSPKR